MGEELCPQLGLTIPVGKDSMSMKTRWQEGNEQREMTSPLSLVISAFARVEDVRHTLTPQLSTEDNALLLIDLGKGHNALGATALAQVYRQLGDKPADVRDVAQLKNFYDAMQALVAARKLLALARPFRRRSAGDAGRDGLCRPLRRAGRYCRAGR